MRQGLITLSHLIFLLEKSECYKRIKTLVALFLFYGKAERKVEKMRKGNKRLNFADRERIEKMVKAGAKVTDIAVAVGVHRATIYNELKRGGEPYCANVAQRTL